MTSKQPNNPEENEQQQANASDSPYQPPAHSQQPGTSGGVQDGQSQAGSQNQYAQQPSGVSSQTPPSGDDNVSQAADQATPGGVSAEDNQSASDTPRSGDQTSRPAKQPGSTETVVQPPEDDERQSVREELLSAINSDETDTWVGSKDEDTQSNAVQQPDNAVSGQQQASQQPAEQPPDTAQTTSDTPQTQDGAVQGGAQTFPQSAADTTGSSQENQPVPPPPDQTGSQQVSDETQQPGSGSQEPTPEPQQPPAGQLEPATPEAQSGLQAASSQQENTEAAPPETVNSQEPVSQAESTPQQPAAEPQQPQKGGQDEGIDPGDTVAPDQTSQVAADGTQPPAESSGPAPASSASPASNQNVQNEAVQPGTDENVQQNGPDQTTPPETQTPVQSAPQQGGNALDVAQSNQQTDQAAEQPSEQAVAGEGVQNQSQPEASETPQPKPGEVYIDEEGNVHRG